MNKILKLLLIIFLPLGASLVGSFALISDANSQNLKDMSQSQYYLDSSKLYNTTLPISDQTVIDPIEPYNSNRVYYQTDNYYDPYEKHYDQNFNNRNKISKQPLKTSYKQKDPEIKVNKPVNNLPSTPEYRTAGNYLGVDFINTQISYREYSGGSYPSATTEFGPISRKNSFGLKYLYALNYKRFFLAPEIFYEYNDIRASLNPDVTSNPSQDTRLYKYFGYKTMQISRRYGGKLNFGYDITPDFAPYLFGGIAKTHHSNLASMYTASERSGIIQNYGKDPFVVVKKATLIPFYGFGAKVRLSSRFYVNAEYVISEFSTETGAYKVPEYTTGNVNRADNIYNEVNIRIFKLGATYNF